MDALLDWLVAYQRFALDFLAMRALAPYERLGALAAPLWRHLGVAVAIALVIALLPLGGPRPHPGAAGDPPPRGGVVLQVGTLLPTFALGTVVLHALLSLYSAWIGNIQIGALADTANGAAAYLAAYLPIHVMMSQMRRAADWHARTRERARGVLRNVKLATGLVQLAFPVYILYAVASVYGMSMRATLRPVLVSAVGTIVVLTAIAGMSLITFRRRGRQSFTT